jgi:hypothetical protein
MDFIVAWCPAAVALTRGRDRWYPGEIRTGEAQRRAGAGVLLGWWLELTLLANLAALTAALATGHLLGLDLARPTCSPPSAWSWPSPSPSGAGPGGRWSRSSPRTG